MIGKLIKKTDFVLIALIVITLIVCFIFAGHYSGMLTDLGREMVYPEQILKGKVLYKDLFNIYGPMAYMLNAFWYKIFGIRLETLYAVGTFLLIAYSVGVYYVSRIFLDKKMSFIISLLGIIILGASTNIFNFTLPYSQAVTYGVTFFVWSIYFLLKFYDEKQSLFLINAGLFSGLAIANKYEFIPYGLLFFALIVVEFIKNKKLGIKAFFAFCTPLIVSFSLLFIQGLKISEFLSLFDILNKIAHTQTLKAFYQSVGVMFSFKVLYLDFVALIKSGIIFTIIFGVIKLWQKHKIFAVISAISVFPIICAAMLKDIQQAFLYLPLLLLVIFVVCYKKLSFSKRILIASALLLCFKTFWAFVIYSYGSFYLPIVILAFVLLVSEYKNLYNASKIYLILFIISTVLFSINGFSHVQSKISTEKGTIYTSFHLAKSVNELMNFIQTKTDEYEKILVLPEGMPVNFLSNRQGEDFYNTLIPLYVEAFGEKNIIDYFKVVKPNYIIFTNSNFREYGVSNICNDYAFDFCGFVAENYEHVYTIDNNTRFLIFKKK